MTTKSNRCAFGLNALKNSDLITTTDRIEKQIENTLAFSEIQPSPAEVRVVLDKFKEEYTRCELGNRQKVGYRNQLRKELLALLRLQLRGVNYIAKDDIDLLEQSGFPVQRQPEPSHEPQEATIKMVEAGDNRGSFKVTLTPWKGRKYYMLEVKGSNGVTRTYTSTKSKFLITDFAPGEPITIAACIYNSVGNGPWSRKLTYVVPAYDAVVSPGTGDKDNKNMKVA
jgi:hypothetical protein